MILGVRAAAGATRQAMFTRLFERLASGSATACDVEVGTLRPAVAMISASAYNVTFRDITLRFTLEVSAITCSEVTAGGVLLQTTTASVSAPVAVGDMWAICFNSEFCAFWTSTSAQSTPSFAGGFDLPNIPQFRTANGSRCAVFYGNLSAPTEAVSMLYGRDGTSAMSSGTGRFGLSTTYSPNVATFYDVGSGSQKLGAMPKLFDSVFGNAKTLHTWRKVPSSLGSFELFDLGPETFMGMSLVGDLWATD